MKVLVVHGEKGTLTCLADQLSTWYVEKCTTGLEGLLAAKVTTYDMIICTQNLQIITGVEMVRSIRNLSLNRNTPVIFLADGHETEGLVRVYQMLNASLLTLDEVSAMNNLKIE
jgi:DNA-binding response OmpR family regulator